MPIRKLPMVGIAGGGKTSLILTLKREFKILKKDMKPTKGIERSKLKFLDSDIIVWDFGGQEKYRNSYKKRADSYFSEIKELFYIIDFQDDQSLFESYDYFVEIKEAIMQYSPDATINIIINKFDPGYEESPLHNDTFNTIVKKFQELSKPVRNRISRTTIFNPLSVIKAFSKPIFQNTTLYDNFQLLFMEFIKSGNGCQFIMIFTKDLMEIGNYFDESVNQQQMRDISMEIFDAFTKKKLSLSHISIDVKNIRLNIITFVIGKDPFYFTYGFDHTKIPDSAPLEMEAFNLLEDIKKIMNYF